MTLTGYKQTEEHKNRISEGRKGMKLSEEHKKNIGKGKKGTMIECRNEKHYRWKGDSVSYRGLHSWVLRKKGKPKRCAFCKKPYTTPRSLQWANIDHEYKRDLDDYIGLCYKCHGKLNKLIHIKAC